MTTLGIVHPGSMGAAIAGQATGSVTVIWCEDGRSAASAARAREHGLTAVATLPELADRADIILSVCPPANAAEVAATVAACAFSGFYVDANAISPQTAESICADVERGGATFVDGSVVGSPPGAGKRARLYLAGPDPAVRATAALFRGTHVVPHVLSGGIGSASALKLAYSSYQKASRVLAAVAYALAAEHGVETDLLDIAADRVTSYLAEPDYFPKVAARAWRWAPEMREAASALAASGLPPDLADAAADVMDFWRGAKDRQASVSEALSQLRGPGPSVGREGSASMDQQRPTSTDTRCEAPGQGAGQGL
jgi:3-hydroxyisobutyrate dehydrogenase-like beta-hydroxyacid dehydrogenase